MKVSQQRNNITEADMRVAISKERKPLTDISEVNGYHANGSQARFKFPYLCPHT